MRRRREGIPTLEDHHVSINVENESLRTRGMGAGPGAAAAVGLAGPAPLDTLLKEEAGASKHVEVLRYLKKTLDEERREFSKLQQDVWDSLTEHEVMEASFDRQFEAQQSFGDQAAEHVASIGGSWRFVFGFSAFIALWAVINTTAKTAFDPYPFILLNLCLSCLSAFQAPVILMSQNKQVQRDRCQSDYTARVNLRAELVTRHINAKLDALISTAWRRLYESQAIQTSMAQSLLALERQQVALVRALGRAQARARAGSREDVSAAPGGSSDGNTAGDVSGVFASSLAYRAFGRRLSEEAAEPSSLQELVPGMVLQVYDKEDEGEEEGEAAGADGDGEAEVQTESEHTLLPQSPQRGGPGQAGAAAVAAVDGGGDEAVIAAPGEPTSAPLQGVQSSSLVVQPSTSPVARAAPRPTAFSVYSTPLAALSVAPPAARGLRALDLPWLLETEEDPHTIFLMRTMLRALAGGAGRGGEGAAGGLWEDAERMIFEHRSISADNFVGSVSDVHIQSHEPSLATKGVVCTVGVALGRAAARRREGLGRPLMLRGQMDEEALGTRGRRVAPAFVSRVVEAASLMDTGGGAEPWFPFDVAYDLRFPGEGAALDSLLAGDAILTLRNALDLPFQTSMGEIRQMTLHPRGCPCSRLCAANGDGAPMEGRAVSQMVEGGAGGLGGPPASSALNPSLSRAMSLCAGAIHVRQGEIPPRFKPSLSQDRDDRISDFWKMPLSRVQISYSPAPIFACVTLRPGQSVVPLSVEFLSHPRQQHPVPARGQGEFSTPPLSRQGSGSGYGILLPPLSRQGSAQPVGRKSPMHHEIVEPAPQLGGRAGNTWNSSTLPAAGTPTNAGASGPDRGSLGSSTASGNSLTLSHHASSLKKVIELWHGRHHGSAATAGGAGAGGERAGTPDSVGTSATGATAGGGADGIAAIFAQPEELLRGVSQESGGALGGGKELLAIINPSAESLCEVLAHGEEWTGRRRRKGSGARRRKGSKSSDGEGGEAGGGDGGRKREAGEEGGASDGDEEEEEDDDDETAPLHLDTLPPAALDNLPHNRWLALPLHKAGTAPADDYAGGGGGGGGRLRTSTYEIDMPCIPGPAVIFFYSPYGRLRLRGVLRDAGAEPILEMD